MQSKALIDDPDHYMKSFKAFSASTSKFDLYGNWVDNAFSEAVVAKLGVTLHKGEELRVLGVGSGSGEMDCMMIEKLLQRFPRINNCAVEPLREMVVKYKDLAQSMSHELQGVTFDWRQQTIEQYEKAGDLTTFHFISMVHSIYYVNNVSNTLMYLYNRLEPGGVMFVILKTDCSGISRFRDQIPYTNDQGFYLHSAEFRSILDQQNIPYTHYPLPAEKLEITNCFDEASEKGNFLLDFFSQAVNFRETAPEDVKRRAIECLGSIECSEKLGEKIILSDECDAVVITKTMG